jgi:hypothetical protein
MESSDVITLGTPRGGPRGHLVATLTLILLGNGNSGLVPIGHSGDVPLTGEGRKVNWRKCPCTSGPGAQASPPYYSCRYAQQPRLWLSPRTLCTPPIEAIANYCSIPSKQHSKPAAIAQVADTPPEGTHLEVIAALKCVEGFSGCSHAKYSAGSGSAASSAGASTPK